MKRFRILFAALIVVTVLVAVVFTLTRSVGPAVPSVRALWVTRFDYDSPADVTAIINNVAAAGFTDIFFQIRGNGSVFFKSDLEPWAHDLSGRDLAKLGTDPGWDPLQLAIDTAKPSGLRVHAYMNTLPGWKGLADPPAAAGQLWTKHRDWFMVDSLGARMRPTSGWYAFVNPVLPEVRAHLRGIVKELCRYDIAGVHIDYIRYPNDYALVAGQHYPDATQEELARHSDFSYDDASMNALFEKYGADVTKEEISAFRRDSVSQLVRDISYVIQMEKPDACLLSASVMGNPIEGKTHAYQDSGAWARRGLVDWVVQMNYATKSFNRYLEWMKKATGNRKFRSSVVVGLYLKHDVEETLAQIETVKQSGCRGLAFFSYKFLFDENHQVTEKGRVLLPKIRP